jgi:uncharacterized membrane protein YeaQ/YmgE (transglycosylase-associated protein family)
MINLIVSAIVGIVVGLLARFFYPGVVSMGLLLTMILGIAGSLVAGLIANRGTTGFQRAGFLASIVGAMVLIFLARLLNLGA